MKPAIYLFILYGNNKGDKDWKGIGVYITPALARKKAIERARKYADDTMSHYNQRVFRFCKTGYFTALLSFAFPIEVQMAKEGDNKWESLKYDLQ